MTVVRSEDPDTSPKNGAAASSAESEARLDPASRPSRSSSTVLPAALHLAQRGLQVFRLKAGDKAPDTAHGHKDAVSDPHRVTAMFTGRPDTNLGIRTGAESNVVVLDIDTRHGGDESLAQFEKRHGALPKTVVCVTGGGGRHIYFRHPGEVLRNRAGVRPGLDVRGDGGYVVAPPSMHESGRPYTWAPGCAPGEVEFAALPAALLKLLRSRAKTVQQRAGLYLAKCAAAAEGERNQRAFTLSGHLRALVDDDGEVLPEGEILQLVRDWNSKNVPPLEDDELVRCVVNSAQHGHPPEPKLPMNGERKDKPHSNDAPNFALDGRPTLVVRAGEQHRVADECVRRMSHERPPTVFARFGQLVVLVKSIGSQPIANARERIKVHALTESGLSDELNRRNQFLKLSVNRQTGCATLSPQDCPVALARWLLSRGAWAGLPNLAAILTAPTILPSGEVVAVPGYHAASGLYLDCAKDEFPPIALKPTKEDALAALNAHILPLYAEFPFVSPAARAVAISSVFTALARFAFTYAPLHGFDAPSTSSGKTLLAAVAGLILDGIEPSPIALADKDEEMEKRVGAALLEGLRVAVIDNIRRPFGGDLICSAITSPSVKVRMFHTQKLVPVPTWATVWLATGNNLSFDVDLGSRALRCRIDAKLERPQERTFTIANLRAHVLQHRGAIVSAALTCLRAYEVAGRPSQGLKPLNRFEGWDLVRSCLVWLGVGDPVETMDGPGTTDQVTDELGELLHGLRSALGAAEFTAATAVACAKLKNVLVGVCRAKSGEGLDARRLGIVLRRGEGRVVAGLRLEIASTAHGVNAYRVVEVPVSGGSGGTGGSAAPSPTQHTRACEHTHEDEGGPFREGTEQVPPVPPLPPKSLDDFDFGEASTAGWEH